MYAALRVPELQVPAIWALGHIGNVRAADACVAGMQHEPIARACGEAYCWITGADLERDTLAVEETPADAPAFEDDDLDANLVPPPEALWPLPDAEAVKTTLARAFESDVVRERASHPRQAGQRRHAAGDDGNGADAAETRPGAGAAREDARALRRRAARVHGTSAADDDGEPRGRVRSRDADRAAAREPDAVQGHDCRAAGSLRHRHAVRDRQGDGDAAAQRCRSRRCRFRRRWPTSTTAIPRRRACEHGSEMHIGKAGTDVLLIGSAWAPDERPVPRMQVGMSVAEPTEDDPRHRRSRVARTAKPSRSEAVRVDAAGLGARVRRRASERRQGRRPRSAIRSDADLPADVRPPTCRAFAVPESRGSGGAASAGRPNARTPACLAPIAPSWLPRRAFAGTYDERWQRARAPYLPDDFDPRFFQCAAPEFAFDRYLQAGEAGAGRRRDAGRTDRVHRPELASRASRSRLPDRRDTPPAESRDAVDRARREPRVLHVARGGAVRSAGAQGREDRGEPAGGPIMSAVIGATHVLCAIGSGTDQVWASARAGIARIASSHVMDRHFEPIQMGLVPEDALAAARRRRSTSFRSPHARGACCGWRRRRFRRSPRTSDGPVPVFIGLPALTPAEAPWLVHVPAYLQKLTGRADRSASAAPSCRTAAPPDSWRWSWR